MKTRELMFLASFMVAAPHVSAQTNPDEVAVRKLPQSFCAAWANTMATNSQKSWRTTWTS